MSARRKFPPARPKRARVAGRARRSIQAAALAALALALLAAPPVLGQADRAAVSSAIRVESAALPPGASGGFASGRVWNDSAYRIGGVRVRVDSADASGRALEPVYGWVLGDIQSRGRGVFRVALPAGAASYTAAVISFDLISVESP